LDDVEALAPTSSKNRELFSESDIDHGFTKTGIQMGYIQEIRALVGSRPIIMVGTGVLLLRGNKVLLQRRKDNGLWGLPGGSLEPGESLEESARREVLEETGLEVAGLNLFGVYSGKEQFFVYPNGDQIYDVCVVYSTGEFHGEMAEEAREVLELRFFALDELPEDLTPLDKPVLADLKRQAARL
jgi:ADP-ribose pyrophosphatase YjhB (NUDIX family)